MNEAFPTTTPAALAGFPVVIALPIQWGEQDALGHVNNTTAIRWFESARIAYLEKIGLMHDLSAAATLSSGAPIGPILASVHCNYRRQLKFPDTVHVGARVVRIGRTSLTMEHATWSAAHQAIAADGDSVIVAFDYAAQRPIPVPAELVAAMEKLEGRSLQ